MSRRRSALGFRLSATALGARLLLVRHLAAERPSCRGRAVAPSTRPRPRRREWPRARPSPRCCAESPSNRETHVAARRAVRLTSGRCPDPQLRSVVRPRKHAVTTDRRDGRDGAAGRRGRRAGGIGRLGGPVERIATVAVAIAPLAVVAPPRQPTAPLLRRDRRRRARTALRASHRCVHHVLASRDGTADHVAPSDAHGDFLFDFDSARCLDWEVGGGVAVSVGERPSSASGVRHRAPLRVRAFSDLPMHQR